MLATLTDDYFDDPDWIYERKLDGVRCLLVKNGNKVKLYSRNEKSLNNSYPELEEACVKLSSNSFIADGEIVAFDGNVTSFSRLQNRMQVKDPEKARANGTKVYLYLFDLLYFESWSVEQLHLRDRKQLLRKLLKWQQPIRYTPHRNEKGKAYHRQACKKGWEGIIAKDSTSTYLHSRSRSWLKFKCSAGQELVIGGFTEPSGERVGFGALLMGFYSDDKLLYAGKVGTGYDDEFLKTWRKKLGDIERKTSPFADLQDKDEAIHWVSPRYVAEVGFTEWTGSHKLRHPRFLGIRDDKDPKDVVRENRTN